MSPDPQVFLSHIIAQTRSNIEILKSINQISDPDAQLLLSKLPPVSQSRDLMGTLAAQTQNLAIAPIPFNAPSPQNQPRFGRALWDYSGDPNDLAFRSGDIIEIVEETNADWYTGRLNGKQALFPANYIERLPPSTAPTPVNNHSEKATTYNYNYQSPPASNYSSPPQSNYSSPPPHDNYSSPPLHNNYSSPPPNMGYQQQYNQYSTPPQQDAVVAAPAQEPPKKEGKVSGLKNTLMHSAVGGVGLGAGSAVGSGIINAIF